MTGFRLTRELSALGYTNAELTRLVRRGELYRRDVLQPRLQRELFSGSRRR